MPLETGSFIPELDDNNPLGSDNVSQGDDHVRLIKRCVQGSFPAFVGNAGTPKSVSKTEDQLNDTAEKSEIETITGAWRFLAPLITDDILAADILADSVAGIASANLTDKSLAEIIGGSWSFTATLNAADIVATSYDGILSANLLDRSVTESIPVQWEFAGGLRLANNAGLFSRNSADSADVPLVRLDGGDFLQLGDGSVDVVFHALANLDIEIAAAKIARFVTTANGTLLIDDRTGSEKKAGFRNPSVIATNADRALNQDDEGRVLLVSSNNIDLTTPSLEAFTTVRLMVTGSGCTLAPAAAAINVLDGSGAPVPAASGINIAENSVIEIVYQTGTLVQVFGNGITVI